MSRVKAVQVSKPGGNFEIVERPIPEPARGQVVSRSKPAASVTAMLWSKKDTGPESNIRACPATRLQGA